ATANGSRAISIDAGFQGSLSGNTATGTGTNGVVVRPGPTFSNITWSQLSMPYVISCPIVFFNITPVTVGAGFSLTIPPGVVVKFASNCPNGNFLSSLLVNGTLIANGTAQQTIAFTAFSDDSAGGDTNGNGNATTPQP